MPTDLQDLFTFSSDTHTTHTSNSADKNFLRIPSIKTVTNTNKYIKAINNIANNNVGLDQSL